MNKSDFQKPKRFDIMPIIDTQDRLEICNNKLRFMGTILGNTDLDRFGNEWPDGETLRYGMEKIILDIADEHEKNINQLQADYNRCPEAIIRSASNIDKIIMHRRYKNSAQALEDIDESVRRLDSVIDTFGDDYPEAKSLRASLLDKKKQLSKSSPVTGQEMKQTG